MTPEWRAVGGQCIVVRETPSLGGGGNSIFGPLPFGGDSLKIKKNGGKGIRVNHREFCIFANFILDTFRFPNYDNTGL